MLEFYIDHIGPYSYEKLAQVQANGVGGGMELASEHLLRLRGAGPGRQLIAHEMAHQWFGDSVTEGDWDDVWLSEGFATYFALLYQEFAGRPRCVPRRRKRSKTQAIELRPGESGLDDRPQESRGHQQGHRQQRADLPGRRAGAAEHPRRDRHETFWAGIRLYYARFQNSNATTEDFRHAMEDACAAAGDRCPADGRDLTWFFRELLNRGGALQVTGSWRYDAAAKQVEVTLDQTQTTGLYRCRSKSACRGRSR